MSTKAHRKGYSGEITARDELRSLGFSRIERTGSLAYKADAADLIQVGEGEPVIIVATKDDRRPVLYTMDAEGLAAILLAADSVMSSDGLAFLSVVVQCKKRKNTWVGTLYADLRKAVEG